MLYMASRVPYVMKSKNGLSERKLDPHSVTSTGLTIVEAYAGAQPGAMMIHCSMSRVPSEMVMKLTFQGASFAIPAMMRPVWLPRFALPTPPRSAVVALRHHTSPTRTYTRKQPFFYAVFCDRSLLVVIPFQAGSWPVRVVIVGVIVLYYYIFSCVFRPGWHQRVDAHHEREYRRVLLIRGSLVWAAPSRCSSSAKW
jgi:hypothetical protein